MLEKMIKRQLIFRRNSVNLWLIMMTILSISLGCSFWNKTETTVATKQITLADVKNSRDLIAVIKTHDRVKDYVLTKAINEEKTLSVDGEIAEVTTEYWSGLETLNMNVMKFSSPEKATQYIDGEESNQKSKGRTPARGKKSNGDPTLFFGDGKGTMTFITCKKDFCYNFSQKSETEVVKVMVASADFFAAYDEKYLSSKN